MTGQRWISLSLLVLCGGISIFCANSIISDTPNALQDFKGVYYGTRCLLQRKDPYMADGPLRIYLADRGIGHPEPGNILRQILGHEIYPPNALIFFVPLAILPPTLAQMLWMYLSAACLIFAAGLIWDLGASYSLGVSGCLTAFVLANSETLLAGGNPAGVAISLCLIGVWCFVRERFLWLGVLSFAVSLSIKPHDAGLIWLYFLLAGGAYRKRALQTIALVVIFSVPAVLWASYVAPHWIPELRSDLAEVSMHGKLSDPGPASVNNPYSVIDLQAAISILRDDPRVYNTLSYAVCGALLIVWAIKTVRSRATPDRVWLALAGFAALSLLPIYHRLYDSKLLLLTVPAASMLWSKGGLTGRLALLVNAVVIILTGDIPLVTLFILTKDLHLLTLGLPGKLLAIVLMRPATLAMLVTTIFYLCVYYQHERHRPIPETENHVGRDLPLTF
jgi:hypothetical protein